MSGDDFAALLRELKERSGLSYGALAKRLHMSTSTLHRYVNGDVVPPDYAPVERLARACRATPEELLELHRGWVRADALRGMKVTGPKDEPGADASGGGGPVGEEPGEKPGEKPGEELGEKPGNEPGAELGEAEPPVADPAETGTPLPTDVPPPAPRPAAPPRRRRTAVLAGAGVAAVAAAVALTVSLVPGRSGGTDTRERAAGATVAAAKSPRPSARSAAPSHSASASPSPSPTPPASTGAPSPSRTATPDDHARDETGPVAVTVATTPYYWDVPCEQSFLVDRSPGNVPKPPPQQDAEGWAVALGAVAADHQMVTLTVQGTGARTVVLQALHVRVVSSDKPLTWNKYAMGNGCGGGVDTKSFDVSLDLGNPLAMPVGGQRDFPYKVSESDPEVFYVNAHTSGHDVRWYLELEWSSGTRHGTVRVDDHGRPFRTSGSQKPYWVYPLGGGAWEQVSEY
ncbi:helix-turn-helix domain-containing protein [Streptomyces sp. NPDC014801]|uniref:helix-turn-helix domain-containing protein n=1 Tax=Streptomyces sp. NPDC014801 TaxID=3364916 RepID=UPI0037018A33